MTTALPYWKTRIAPVLDTAQHLCIVTSEKGVVKNRATLALPHGFLPIYIAGQCAELHVDTLICGALSRGMHMCMDAYGIRVIPFITGELETIIDTWLTRPDDVAQYTMPGCRRGPVGHCHGRGRGRGVAHRHEHRRQSRRGGGMRTEIYPSEASSRRGVHDVTEDTNNP